MRVLEKKNCYRQSILKEASTMKRKYKFFENTTEDSLH